MTKKGEAKFAEMFPAYAKCVEELASVLTEDELNQLSVLLKKLGLALKNK